MKTWDTRLLYNCMGNHYTMAWPDFEIYLPADCVFAYITPCHLIFLILQGGSGGGIGIGQCYNALTTVTDYDRHVLDGYDKILRLAGCGAFLRVAKKEKIQSPNILLARARLFTSPDHYTSQL